MQKLIKFGKETNKTTFHALKDSSLVVPNLKSSSNLMVTGCVEKWNDKEWDLQTIEELNFASLQYYSIKKMK